MRAGTVDWNWPGARWWKFDLHVHSPHSSDWRGDPSLSALAWVEAAVAAGLHAVALTDHNGAGWVDRVKAAAQTSGLVVFPGAEITTEGGAHILAILSPEANSAAVSALLGGCGLSLSQQPNAEARTTKSFLDVAAIARQGGAITIAAHVDDAAGIFDKLKAGALRAAIVDSELDAFEWKGVDRVILAKLDGTDPSYRRPGGRLAIVQSSDAHDTSRIGSRATWFKMARPSMEGLQLALMDPELSVLPGDSVNAEPNTHANCVIERLSVARTKYIGNGEPFVLALNPWLNAIIGGRGTGKSSLVEFIRLVSRREDELPNDLRGTFNKLARVPASKDDFGLLRKGAQGESEIELVYRRDGARFRLRWNASAPEPAIETESAPGVWTAAEGDIRERFPVRIFSQKQVFELAEEPGKLLELIDNDPEVGASAVRSDLQRLEAEYLQFCAERRAVSARLRHESKIRGELDDVLRKIGLFEQAGHAAVLRQFQRRTRQAEAIRTFRTDIEKHIQAIERSARAAVPGAFDSALFNENEPEDKAATDHLKELQAQLSTLSASVVEAAQEASNGYAAWLERLKSHPWAAAFAAGRDAYNRLVDELQASGVVDPHEYGKLVQRRQALETALREFDVERSRLATIDAHCIDLLGACLNGRRELSRRRRDFLTRLQPKVPNVRLDLVQYGAREAAEKRLREILVAEDKYTRDLGSFDPADPSHGQDTILGILYPNPAELADTGAADLFEGLLANIKDKLVAAGTGNTDPAPYGAVFVKALQRLHPEQLDRLRLWWPEDLLMVSYRTKPNEKFKRLDQGSPGQKTSALLAFFLAYGDEPLLIDQPEDDLDNELIYDLLVQRLREIKATRQVIVVTHNPNVVVNGDAEFIVPISIKGGRVTISTAGTLQEGHVRDEICRIMEGGTEALKQRFRRLVTARQQRV